MKMHKIESASHHPSLWVILIPLLVAFAIIGGAVFISDYTTENRSKASYSGLSRCLSTCNGTGVQADHVRDRAACALSCTPLMGGQLTCESFCDTHMTQSNQQARSSCRQMCERWVQGPCDANGAVCMLARSSDDESAKSQCGTACNQVKSGSMTCEKAMTDTALSALSTGSKTAVRASCRVVFEQQSAWRMWNRRPSITTTPHFRQPENCSQMCSSFPSEYRTRCREACGRLEHGGSRTCLLCQEAPSTMRQSCLDMMCPTHN